ARHLGRGARGLPGARHVGSGTPRASGRALCAALGLHGCRARRPRADHREARRRQRALHARRGVPRIVIGLIVTGGLSYLLGSVIGSLLIARLTGGVDIRKLGSGNAGATNALRTQGKKIAFGVLAIDLAKGWIATALLAPAVLPGITPAVAELRGWST